MSPFKQGLQSGIVGRVSQIILVQVVDGVAFIFRIEDDDVSKGHIPGGPDG